MGQQVPAIGQDVTALMPQVGEDVTALMSSHKPSDGTAKPIATGGGRGTGLDVRKSDKWLSTHAPAIGAGMATLATGGTSIPLLMAAAAGGGAIGSGLRGDDAGTIIKEGVVQGALEGAGGLAVRGGRAIAHGLMRGTVPKNIAKDFADVDIAGTMLDRGVVPGSARSARRVEGLSTIANAERDAAAQVVPVMHRRKVVEGLRPMHQKGVTGKVPEMSEATLEQMRKSAREIGPDGLTGPEALARKDIKQAQGRAALTSSDSRAAAFGSQLADAERGAIVSHLRETPRMGGALNDSQALMAVDQVMKDAAHSNPLTRARIGGMTAASLSPIGVGATAHAVNQGSKVLDPQVIRLLDMIMRGGSQ